MIPDEALSEALEDARRETDPTAAPKPCALAQTSEPLPQKAVIFEPLLAGLVRRRQGRRT